MGRLRNWRLKMLRGADRLSSTALARAENPDWFDTTENSWTTRTLTKPRRFTDARSLEMFVTRIAMEHGVWVGDYAEGNPDFAQGIDNVAKFAATIADRPVVFRKTINVQTSGGDGITPDGQRVIHYTLRQKGDRVRASTVIKSNDLALLNRGTKLLMKHTEPLNKAQIRAKIPLVEPYTILEEATARREHEIANRARVQGAVWGAVAGVIAALITSGATLLAAAMEFGWFAS